MIIVASPDYLESNDLLKKETEKDNSVLPLVHPGYYVKKCAKIEKLEKEVEDLLALKDPRISLKRT